MVADVAIVKLVRRQSADRTWLSFLDGTARRAAVHVIHDLPHLVVESVFGLDDGLWGTLAATAWASSPRAGAVTRRNGRHQAGHRRSDASFDELAYRDLARAHGRVKAAVNAVLNRWGDGPGHLPDGVRDRLRADLAGCGGVAGRPCSTTSRVRVAAAAGCAVYYRDWAELPVGGTLRATWPLHDSWLRLLVTGARHDWVTWGGTSPRGGQGLAVRSPASST